MPGRIIIGDLSKEDQTFIYVEATNIGDRPTTITNMIFQHYKTYLSMLFHKPSGSMFVNKPSESQPLPYLLNPGSIWQGLVPQTPEIETLAMDGYFVCGLIHSHSNKEIDKRVIIKKTIKCMT